MGVDVESDFVTNQAVHIYRTGRREAELPEQSAGMTEREAETIERLQGWTPAVTESTIDALTSNGQITDHSDPFFVR